jgi:YHS domain-containing protein
VWTGCGRRPDSEESAPSADLKATPGAAPSRPSQEALLILAKADSFDGEKDRTISKCLTCSLRMDGDAQHASAFGSYKLHLCSETCKESFDAEPEEAILTATLPASLK